MKMDKICRCCLTNGGPLLTIYDGGITNKDCLAGMINEITGIKPHQNDKLPDKVCLMCIREIKNFYAFKIKCEVSHRTLKQLFLSKVEVQLCSPIQTHQMKNATENKNVINLGRYQLTPTDAVQTTQMKEDEDYSQSENIESNMEAAFPISYVYKFMTSSAQETIQVKSSPISLQNSSLPIETISHLENFKQNQSLTTKIAENTYKKEFTDSESNSCDSIEFISEKPKINERIVILDEFGVKNSTVNYAEVNDTTVEYTFMSSSPQLVPEEVINLNLVNEAFNFDNVQIQSYKNIEDLCRSPNHVDISAGSHNQCVMCKQGFKQDKDFINHLKTSESPYQCKFCKNCLSDYSNLRVHLMEHKNGTKRSRKPSIRKSKTLRKVKRIKKRNHACDLCPNRFSALTTLINHRRTHTGEKPFKCKYCDKSFTQLSTCSNHEKRHTGDRPFKCQYCDKKFLQTSTHRAHEIIHTGKKPYSCQICHMGFVHLAHKNTHEKSHKSYI